MQNNSLSQKKVKPNSLGLGWNESEDTIFNSLEKKESEPTKRGVSQTLVSIYDPLGIISPVTLMGKIILTLIYMGYFDYLFYKGMAKSPPV